MVKFKNQKFIVLLVLIILAFPACSDQDMITADESIASYLEKTILEMDKDSNVDNQEKATAVKLHGEDQLGNLKLIAFTCREASLGGLLLEELEDGNHRFLADRIEDSIPEDVVTHIKFVYHYKNQNVACIVNNGDAAKVTIFTGEGEKASYDLCKPNPSAYLINLDSIGSKKSNEFSFQLQDKDGNILEEADDNKCFTFSENFSASD